MTLNVVQDRPCAELLPSRRHFALTRLIAFARMRLARGVPTPSQRVIHALDRDQTAAEMYVASFGFWLLLTCYIAAALPLHPAAAVIAAAVMAQFAIQLSVVGVALATGLVTRAENRVKLNSVVLMTAVLLVSSYVATLPGDVRYAAWVCLGAIAANAAAAAILWLLRHSVRAAEEQCAG